MSQSYIKDRVIERQDHMTGHKVDLQASGNTSKGHESIECRVTLGSRTKKIFKEFKTKIQCEAYLTSHIFRRVSLGVSTV